MSLKNYTVINNDKAQRFEIHQADEIAFMEYRLYKNDIALMHTGVPDALEGKGMASTLAKYALNWAMENKKLVLVYCHFVAAYLKKHPEYNAIVDKNYT